MSGEFFDYKEHFIEYMIDELDEKMRTFDRMHENAECENYSDDVKELMRVGLKKLKEAYIYSRRISYLLSGDDGEEEFKRKLAEELKELG